MANAVLSPELLRELQDLIRWKRAFNVTGALKFENKQQSCSIAIGSSDQSPPPVILRGLTPVTLAQTGGSDGTTSAAPTWSYTVTSLLGVELATAKQPQHNRPKGKTMKATRGWARLVSGAWEIWDSDEAPAFAECA